MPPLKKAPTSGTNFIQWKSNGKKFPVGSIREKMWNAYLHDIIEFLANQEYLKILLSIDAESFF